MSRDRPFRTATRRDGTLVVSHDNGFWARVLVAVGTAFALASGYDALVGAPGEARALGLAGAAVACWALALVTFDASRFAFDATASRITWRRRQAWQRRGGSIPFDQVRDVLVESPIGYEGLPMRRIVLRLADGEVLPMTGSFLKDPDDALLDLAVRLRSHVREGISGDIGNVEALVASGRTVEAAKLLRQTANLSMTEARRRVEDMKRRRPDA